MRVAVWDFGGPILKTPFELMERTRERLGLSAEQLDWTGPFDPSRDELWTRFTNGEMTEQEYWQLRAHEFAELAGTEPTFHGLMNEFFTLPESGLVRPESVELIKELKAAGIPVGLLTNDFTAFHPQEWRDQITVMELFDYKVDGSLDRVKKPHRDAYALICERMGVDPGDAVFIDDLPVNIAGAAEYGMLTVQFDVTNPENSLREARELLGLAAVQ